MTEATGTPLVEIGWRVHLNRALIQDRRHKNQLALPPPKSNRQLVQQRAEAHAVPGPAYLNRQHLLRYLPRQHQQLHLRQLEYTRSG